MLLPERLDAAEVVVIPHARWWGNARQAGRDALRQGGRPVL